jgi:type IV secretion system T-DNA border endonuclease VirD2
MARTADTMRSLQPCRGADRVAGDRGEDCEGGGSASTGWCASSFPAEAATLERADLERHFNGWMAETEDRIRKAPIAERKGLRDELYGYAVDIARGLGDARGAQLLQMMPQSAVYGVALEGDTLAAEGRKRPCSPGRRSGCERRSLRVRLRLA